MYIVRAEVQTKKTKKNRKNVCNDVARKSVNPRSEKLVKSTDGAVSEWKLVKAERVVDLTWSNLIATKMLASELSFFFSAY